MAYFSLLVKYFFFHIFLPSNPSLSFLGHCPWIVSLVGGGMVQPYQSLEWDGLGIWSLFRNWSSFYVNGGGYGWILIPPILQTDYGIRIIDIIPCNFDYLLPPPRVQNFQISTSTSVPSCSFLHQVLDQSRQGRD